MLSQLIFVGKCQFSINNLYNYRNYDLKPLLIFYLVIIINDMEQQLDPGVFNQFVLLFIFEKCVFSDPRIER